MVIRNRRQKYTVIQLGIKKNYRYTAGISESNRNPTEIFDMSPLNWLTRLLLKVPVGWWLLFKMFRWIVVTF